MLKKIVYAALAVFAAAVIVLVYWLFFMPVTGMSDGERAEIMAQPRMKLANYDFDPASALESRIKGAPPFLLEFLKEDDIKVHKEHDRVKSYEAYALTPAERAIVAGFLEGLPGMVKATLNARLLGIYFVKNFIGNGMTVPVLGPDGQVYVSLVVNPSGFGRTLSEVLAERDNSLFGTGGTVTAECAKPVSGALYALAHETGHALDYILGLTPYVTVSWRDFTNKGPAPVGDPWDVWEGYYFPAAAADFTGRDGLRFYGLGGKPSRDASEAAPLYLGLASSPFVSLYGSQNWSEDFAEQVFYGCVKALLGRPCAIKYPDGKKTGKFLPGKEADARAMKAYNRLFRP